MNLWINIIIKIKIMIDLIERTELMLLNNS